MRAYALVTADSAGEAVDVFLRREDAETALAECLRDEPDWREVLRVAPIELDDATYRPTNSGVASPA
jgi:hypothetical protein